MPKQPRLKNRARLEMLNYVTRFCLSRNYGDGVNRGCYGDAYFEPIDNPKKGDLIALESVPDTEWYLSWYQERIIKGNCYRDVHVLKSIDSEKLCNWSNVSFYRLNPKVVNRHPQWKWTDRQFEFSDRWAKVSSWNTISFCLYGGHIEFNDLAVTMHIRKSRIGEDRGRKQLKKIFSNWKKVTMRDMQDFWNHTLKKETG